MPNVHFDRYYRYDDLTRLLHAFASEYPDIVSISSIGKSYEGRDIWLATLTNTATGPADEKPASWVDGNIHASEVSPSSMGLYLIDRLTTQYGTDPAITNLLDTRALYIVPRINPDGAEWALADKPKIIRSSTRPWPYDEEPLDGLQQEDVDGDGRMLMMRIADPNGPWKPHPDEPRLLVRREPTETGGTYYRVFPEGTVDNYDGVTLRIKPNKEGLDLNRNFPAGWRQEGQQPGAGPYPVSEPETQAVVDFVARHRNISVGVTFHTFSGVLLRPFGDRPDDELPSEDLWTYQALGKRGTELTGYPNVSIFHEFKYHPKQIISGGFDWAYDHLGIYLWAVEIWSPQRQAGIEDYKFIEWYREHGIEDDLKLLKWSDDKLGGKGFIDWYAFDHPQLGAVELGGWDFQYCWRNPPPQYLEAELAPLADWVIWMAQLTPRLAFFDTTVTSLGGDAYQITATVHNTGWLPAYTTQRALQTKSVRGVVVELDLPGGASLKSGKQREEIGQLEGRSHTMQSLMPWRGLVPTANTLDRAKVEWVVHAPGGGSVTLTVRHDRAGVARTTVTLSG